MSIQKCTLVDVPGTCKLLRNVLAPRTLTPADSRNLTSGQPPRNPLSYCKTCPEQATRFALAGWRFILPRPCRQFLYRHTLGNPCQNKPRLPCLARPRQAGPCHAWPCLPRPANHEETVSLASFSTVSSMLLKIISNSLSPANRRRNIWS